MTSLLAKGIQEQQLEIVGNQNKILDLETDLSLTTSGNLSIVQNDPGSYSVAKVNGASVTRVGAFAELVSAKIRAGVISAREISSTSLTSLTANIGTLTADTISAAMGQFNNATIGALAVASDSVTPPNGKHGYAHSGYYFCRKGTIKQCNNGSPRCRERLRDHRRRNPPRLHRQNCRRQISLARGRLARLRG